MRAPLWTLAVVALLSCSASAQNVFVDDAGTVRQAQRVYVDDAGTVREIQRIYVDDAGTVRQVFQNATYSVAAGASISDSFPSVANAAIEFNLSGDIRAITVAGGNVDFGDWVSPKSLAPGAYTIRASVVSGSTPTGSALDADLALTSSRSWAQTQSGAGSKTGVITLTLKDGGGNVLATGNVTLTATAS